MRSSSHRVKILDPDLRSGGRVSGYSDPEVLEGLVSTSKWPRNEAKFLASSRPRPRKTRIKSLVLKMAEKKAEIPRNSSSRPRKGRGKGKNSSPRLVLDLGKILSKVSSSTSSSLDDTSRTSGQHLQQNGSHQIKKTAPK